MMCAGSGVQEPFLRPKAVSYCVKKSLALTTSSFLMNLVCRFSISYIICCISILASDFDLHGMVNAFLDRAFNIMSSYLNFSLNGGAISPVMLEFTVQPGDRLLKAVR